MTDHPMPDWERVLREWPRERIKPATVARCIDLMLADLAASRAEAEALREHLVEFHACNSWRLAASPFAQAAEALGRLRTVAHDGHIQGCCWVVFGCCSCTCDDTYRRDYELRFPRGAQVASHQAEAGRTVDEVDLHLLPVLRSGIPAGRRAAERRGVVGGGSGMSERPCFCACHESPGVYPPPCGVCGHHNDHGQFKGALYQGWTPNDSLTAQLAAANATIAELANDRDHAVRAEQCIDVLEQQIATLTEQLAEARAALEWYANASSHLENDGGDRARAALQLPPEAGRE